MSYIGNTPQTQGFTPAIDYFNGNGVTVTFTLSRPIASVAQVIVAVDNVIQNPSSAFGVVGNSITFTSAPLAGTNNIWVEYTSLITTYQGISQDPTVIGDIRATGGYLAEGDFGNSFVDGNLIDYVTGAGRLTVGELDDLVFYHGGTSARSEMMRLSYAGNSTLAGGLAATGNITTTGNVGIGTSSPSEKLSVTGNVTATGTNTSATYFHRSIAPATESNIETSLITTGNAANQRAGLFATNDYNNTLATGLIFKTNATTGGATERMRITSGGNLLVGTSSVQNAGNAITCFGGFYSFCLNSGSFNYYFGTDSNNFNVYSGDGVLRGYLGTAGTWTNTSDISYKKDIVDIKYGLQDALNLRPVSYLTKDYDIEQIGFIAQEMEQVIPEVVSGEDGSKGISYGSLVALCIKAIQEQQQIITDLKARIEALEAK
jgi:hypothetical protein